MLCAGVVSSIAAPSIAWTDGVGIEAALFKPSGVSVAPGGAVYVADTFSGRIRIIASSGSLKIIFRFRFFCYINRDENSILSGLVSTAAGSYVGPAGIAVASNGNVFVTEVWTHIIRLISTAGIVISDTYDAFYKEVVLTCT